MIQQLYNLNNGIIGAEYSSSQTHIICPYEIPWNYITECVCRSGIVSSTDILSNNGNKLSQTTLKTMFTLLYTNLYNSPVVIQNTQLPNTQILQNSIFYILKVANQVYEDILIKINFYTTSKNYCDKPYMAVSNLPHLYELYRNYYNNQVYVNSQTHNSIL